MKEVSHDPDDSFENEKLFVQLARDDPHFTALGRIATAWALFENTLDGAIWTLAEINDERGACITSQLMSILPRLKAYMALAQLRGITDRDLVARLHKYIGETEPITQKRNRAIHDAWVVGKQTKKVAQLRVTANRKLDYGFRPGSLEHLEKVRSEIVEHTKRFSKLHLEVRAWLHSMQTKPPG
jgi:hypothetical protein